MSSVPERDPRADPPRRIAFVITLSGPIGGAQLHVLELARALREAGHAVAVFVGEGGPLIELLREAEVEVVPIPDLVREIDPLRDLRALVQLHAALRTFAPDLVTSHCSKAGWLGRAVATKLRIASLFTVHGWLFRDGKLSAYEQVTRLAEVVTAPLADRLLAVCEHDAAIGVNRGIAPREAFAVVHNGLLDDSRRADPGVSPPRLIMVARFTYPKDPVTLIRALAKLRELAWTCELIGDGPERPAVEAALAESGLDDRIALLGTRDDVADRLAAAQVFVLMTAREGLPLSVLEAMRAGLPVVAASVGGIPEAVVDGHTGALVQPQDPDALAAALEPLIRDAELRRAWGRAGRARFEAEFGFETHLRRTWAVYAEVLESGSRRLASKLMSRLRSAPLSARS